MVKQVMTPIGRNVDIEVLHICRSATSKALAKSAGKICTERPVAAVMTAVPLLKLPIKRVLPVRRLGCNPSCFHATDAGISSRPTRTFLTRECFQRERDALPAANAQRHHTAT